MLSVELEPETERRLSELARQAGQSMSEFARELIEASIEDIEDIQMAAERLEKRDKPLNLDQARKALGLDD